MTGHDYGSDPWNDTTPAPAYPDEHGVAWGRPEHEPCQKGTPGCCMDHDAVDAGCEPW